MSNDSENKIPWKIVVAIRRLRKSTLERDIGAQVNCLSYIDAFVGTWKKNGYQMAKPDQNSNRK